MTSNGVINLILRFRRNSIALLATYVTVVEYRLIMFVNIVSRFQSFTFGHNYPTLQRALSAIAELFHFVFVYLFYPTGYLPAVVSIARLIAYHYNIIIIYYHMPAACNV